MDESSQVFQDDDDDDDDNNNIRGAKEEEEADDALAAAAAAAGQEETEAVDHDEKIDAAAESKQPTASSSPSSSFVDDDDEVVGPPDAAASNGGDDEATSSAFVTTTISTNVPPPLPPPTATAAAATTTNTNTLLATVHDLDESPKTFPQVLMEILCSEEDNDTISWLPHGRAFTIYKKKKFAVTILPKHFKATKFTSFTRKLNRWGFTRVTRGPEMGSYWHKLFLRDDPQLCLRMTSHTNSKFQEATAVEPSGSVVGGSGGGGVAMPMMPAGMMPSFMPVPAHSFGTMQPTDFTQQNQMIQQQMQALQWQQFQLQQFQQQQQAQQQQQQQQQQGMDGQHQTQERTSGAPSPALNHSQQQTQQAFVPAMYQTFNPGVPVMLPWMQPTPHPAMMMQQQQQQPQQQLPDAGLSDRPQSTSESHGSTALTNNDASLSNGVKQEENSDNPQATGV